MGKIILLIVIAIVCFWGASLIRVPKVKKDFKPNELKKKPFIKMLNRDGDMYDDEWHTYIAGVLHYVSKYDIGGFTGWIENDFNNAHDSKAMGVYNSYGKLLGYIPAHKLSDYLFWSSGEPMPCVGFIYVEDGQYRGKVKILRPCNKEFLQAEFSRYLQWVYDNYGKEYLPKNISMQFDVEESAP